MPDDDPQGSRNDPLDVQVQKLNNALAEARGEHKATKGQLAELQKQLDKANEYIMLAEPLFQQIAKGKGREVLAEQWPDMYGQDLAAPSQPPGNGQQEGQMSQQQTAPHQPAAPAPVDPELRKNIDYVTQRLRQQELLEQQAVQQRRTQEWLDEHVYGPLRAAGIDDDRLDDARDMLFGRLNSAGGAQRLTPTQVTDLAQQVVERAKLMPAPTPPESAPPPSRGPGQAPPAGTPPPRPPHQPEGSPPSGSGGSMTVGVEQPYKDARTAQDIERITQDRVQQLKRDLEADGLSMHDQINLNG